ncbi:YdiU family protein [Pedobacter sp. L105]|uniref:protein adenylyltransferase SelO n=1 Tax=Pedobacter sp. L105 TaxID=1641871 RepID=UPI00131C5E7C|nr:YdiU family protein [Pedobacter sp. L105]
MDNLSTKTFNNDFVSTFDGDQTGNLQPRQTPGVLYSKAIPTPVHRPQLLAWSDELAEEMGIAQPDQQDINILGGNLVTPTMYPYAACYAGHQFGNWAGQLGDGRAISLGEWPAANGKTYELQLKGAGPTPYSRRGDGRAVLRSSIREYLMSEAMYHLGIPTTRALGLVATGDQVMRDMFYDGRAAYEQGAIVMRVAPSFLRFGNFEMLAARQEIAQLKKLTDWTIDRFYPHLSGENKIINWFKEVVERTATMIIGWLRVGFVHGVMNTDNMSILGLTIDYGPYSFLDDYDPNFTPNTTDLPGRRYAFGRQHTIAYWNLSCLASAIAPLFENTDELVNALEDFKDIYQAKYFAIMADKIGLDELKEEDKKLADDMEKSLSLIKPDMTIFYQLLIDLPLIENKEELANWFNPSFYRAPDKESLEFLFVTIQAYQERMKDNQITAEAAKTKMRANNPRFILRNYLLHQAIQEMEKGQNGLFLKLQEAMKAPYSNIHDEFFALRPDWANDQPGSSTLSCSS